MTNSAVRRDHPRKRDPERPERIIAAARKIAREEGLGAVTHRRIAAEAGIPVGSTTYHFETIEDILSEVIRRDVAGFRAGMEDKIADTSGTAVDRVMRLIHEEAWGGDRRVGYDIYLSALTRPALRPAARAWSEVLIELLARIVPRDRAEVISTLLEGYGLRAAMTDFPASPSPENLREHIERLLA